MKIAILYNAPTLAADDPDALSEAGVLESVEAFERALQTLGREAVRVAAGASAADLVRQLQAIAPALAINLCEGFAGRPSGEPYVAGLLEMLGIPYTGGGPECLALVRDKVRTKWLLRGAGVPTAPFARLRRGDPFDRLKLEAALGPFPWFVKPAAEDASLGIGPESVVCDWAACQRQAAAVRARYGDVLVERYIDGREFNVGVIALPRPEVLPLAEIEFQLGDGLRWPVVTYDSKWLTGSPADLATAPRCPALVDDALADRLRQIALAAFEATDCRDYARVDLRANAAGEVFVLEVNGNPDVGPSAGFARASRAAGLDYETFVERLIGTAMTRGARTLAFPG